MFASRQNIYYPFGLIMKAIGKEGAGVLENKFKFNGIELDTNFGLNEYEAHFRDLDPALGRWWQIDPKIDDGYESMSPYMSMYNNPVRYSDPLGDEADDDPGVLSVLGNFAKGVGQSLVGTVGGVANAILHPIETAQGIGNTLTHPIATGEAISGAIKQGYNDFKSGNDDVKANILGKVVGEIAQIAVGAEAVKAGTEFIKGTKVTESLTEVSKASKGLGNSFKNSTLSEVRASFEKRVENGTMESRGSNAYVNKKSGYSYNVDKGGTYGRGGKKLEGPHIDVNYPNPKPKNVPSKKKLDIKTD